MQIFGTILNKPQVYKVIKKYWMGNRPNTIQFYWESFHYQALQPNYRITYPASAHRKLEVYSKFEDL